MYDVLTSLISYLKLPFCKYYIFFRCIYLQVFQCIFSKNVIKVKIITHKHIETELLYVLLSCYIAPEFSKYQYNLTLKSYLRFVKKHNILYKEFLRVKARLELYAEISKQL